MARTPQAVDTQRLGTRGDTYVWEASPTALKCGGKPTITTLSPQRLPAKSFYRESRRRQHVCFVNGRFMLVSSSSGGRLRVWRKPIRLHDIDYDCDVSCIRYEAHSDCLSCSTTNRKQPNKALSPWGSFRSLKMFNHKSQHNQTKHWRSRLLRNITRTDNQTNKQTNKHRHTFIYVSAGSLIVDTGCMGLQYILNGGIISCS